MQATIHPSYNDNAQVFCSCGNSFVTGSTKDEIRVEICSSCHPVYTGVKRFIDTLGRVDKFLMAQNNAAKVQAAIAEKKAVKEEKTKKHDVAPRSLKEMLEQMNTSN